MTQYLGGRKSALSAMIAFALMDENSGPLVVARMGSDLEPSPKPAPLTQGSLDRIKKARLKRERKSLKRLLTEKRDTIHRCGWCGYPVREDGSFLPGLIDPDHASNYLQINSEAEEQLVNGACCPNGDQW